MLINKVIIIGEFVFVVADVLYNYSLELNYSVSCYALYV